MNSRQAAYQTIKKTLNNERIMRQRVFRQDEKKLQYKLKEIDDALASLEYLAKLAQVEPEAQQATLF